MNDLYSSLPKRVKVGPYTYRIIPAPAGSPGLGENNYGMTVFDIATIYLDENMDAARLLNTTIHEIGHAINQAYGVVDGVEEETVATQSANGWMQVYIDNPRLLQWIQRAVREVRKSR